MPINNKEITKEMLMQAMQCKDADELVALAKTGGIELTKKEGKHILRNWPTLNWMTAS